MSETKTVKVGGALPRVATLKVLEGHNIEITWLSPVNGQSRHKLDLAPALYTYKFYRPLRDDRALFETAHVIDDGSAIAWGADDEIDMAATTLARLAEELMEPADFAAFLKRHNFTFDRAAAELGISRRLVAYYASEREVPRYIALACAYMDGKANIGNAAKGQPLEEKSEQLTYSVTTLSKAFYERHSQDFGAIFQEAIKTLAPQGSPRRDMREEPEEWSGYSPARSH